jgi:hypothetical protein
MITLVFDIARVYAPLLHDGTEVAYLLLLPVLRVCSVPNIEFSDYYWCDIVFKKLYLSTVH